MLANILIAIMSVIALSAGIFAWLVDRKGIFDDPEKDKDKKDKENKKGKDGKK